MKNQELFQTISAATPVSIILCTIDGSKIVYGNERAHALLQGPGDAGKRLGAIGDHFTEPDERDTFFGRIQAEGGVENFETRLRQHDGREIWAMISAKRLKYQGSGLVVPGFSNISSFNESASRLHYRAVTL